jgi:hypothetical protein
MIKDLINELGKLSEDADTATNQEEAAEKKVDLSDVFGSGKDGKKMSKSALRILKTLKYQPKMRGKLGVEEFMAILFAPRLRVMEILSKLDKAGFMKRSFIKKGKDKKEIYDLDSRGIEFLAYLEDIEDDAIAAYLAEYEDKSENIEEGMEEHGDRRAVKLIVSGKRKMKEMHDNDKFNCAPITVLFHTLFYVFRLVFIFRQVSSNSIVLNVFKICKKFDSTAI